MILAATDPNRELFIIGTSAVEFGRLEIGTGPNQVNLAGTNAQIEAKVKEIADTYLAPRGWHCYFSIESRIPRVWHLWAGPTHLEPDGDDWKTSFPIED